MVAADAGVAAAFEVFLAFVGEAAVGEVGELVEGDEDGRVFGAAAVWEQQAAAGDASGAACHRLPRPAGPRPRIPTVNYMEAEMAEGKRAEIITARDAAKISLLERITAKTNGFYSSDAETCLAFAQAFKTLAETD